MKSGLWLSFDLGIDGDYESLYYWLDTQNAIECGVNIAFFRFEYKGDIIKFLSKQINDVVNIRKRDRFYVVYPSTDGKYKGRFLFGKRKRAPWEGMSGEIEGGVDEPT